MNTGIVPCVGVTVSAELLNDVVHVLVALLYVPIGFNGNEPNGSGDHRPDLGTPGRIPNYPVRGHVDEGIGGLRDLPAPQDRGASRSP